MNDNLKYQYTKLINQKAEVGRGIKTETKQNKTKYMTQLYTVNNNYK